MMRPVIPFPTRTLSARLSPLMYLDFVEICGGAAGKVGDSLSRLGFSVAPVLDLSESAHYDLTSLRLLEWIIYMLEEVTIQVFPDCSTLHFLSTGCSPCREVILHAAWV